MANDIEFDMDLNAKEEKEIDDLVRMLDGFAQSGESRLKINLSEELAEGETRKQHHHGRCDIGSPFACGNAFNADTEK